MSRLLYLSVIALGVLLLAGCESRPPIQTYTVVKDTPDRLLGGILLQEDRGWFFKLTGPREQLDARADEFRDFLKSLRVGPDDSQPQWTLPAGWEVDERPRQMRVATINVPLKTETAELTVTMLPRQGDDLQYLLANINRWRDQLSQGRITSSDVRSLERLQTADGQDVLLVSIAGRLKAGGMPAAPFAR